MSAPRRCSRPRPARRRRSRTPRPPCAPPRRGSIRRRRGSRVARSSARSTGAGAADLFPRRARWCRPAGRCVALLPPGNIKVRFFVSEAVLPKIKLGDRRDVRCDGCADGHPAKISFISRTSEFTPPVIYSLEERSKLVFLIEARPETPERLRVGQPVSVALTRGARRSDVPHPTSPSTSTGSPNPSAAARSCATSRCR